MSTPRINYSPRVLQEIVQSGVLSGHDFVLLDVGVSGGLESYWRLFEPYLLAHGFDPLTKEIDRLNAQEKNQKIKYHNIYVRKDENTESAHQQKNKDSEDAWCPKVYERSSSTYAQKLKKFSFTERFNNNDTEVIFTNKNQSIDQFCSENAISSVDFIKIDTDGGDYNAILSAKETLSSREVLGIFVECQFQGPIGDNVNQFSNIDRELRRSGFSLFDLEPYRYTRAALPGKFCYEIFAQTQGGQVLWGDALYLRDYAATGYQERWGKLSPEKLIKLIGLYELFGLYDCAAELILNHQEKLSPRYGMWLDMLSQESDSSALDYQETINRFRDTPEKFFPKSSQNLKPAGSFFYRQLKKFL